MFLRLNANRLELGSVYRLGVVHLAPPVQKFLVHYWDMTPGFALGQTHLGLTYSMAQDILWKA